MAFLFPALTRLSASRLGHRPAADGLVAEWLRRGLQILAPRFDSGRGLQFPRLNPFSICMNGAFAY